MAHQIECHSDHEMVIAKALPNPLHADARIATMRVPVVVGRGQLSLQQRPLLSRHGPSLSKKPLSTLLRLLERVLAQDEAMTIREAPRYKALALPAGGLAVEPHLTIDATPGVNSDHSPSVSSARTLQRLVTERRSFTNS